MLTVACVVPLFMLGMTACADTNDEAGLGASSDGTPIEETDSEELKTEETDAEDADNGSPLDSLSSGMLFDRGLAGDIAVRCDHNDEGDLIGTVYFYGPSKHRLDTVNGEGVPTHIVADGGDGYVWNDAGEAAHYPGGEETRSDEDIAAFKAASSNCVPFSDLSVFEVPADLDFAEAPQP